MTSRRSSHSTRPGWSSKTTPPATASRAPRSGRTSLGSSRPCPISSSTRTSVRDRLVVSEWTARGTHGEERRIELNEIDVFPPGRAHPPGRTSTRSCRRPRVLDRGVARPPLRETADVPPEIARELAPSFEFVESADGADGVIVTPAVRVDGRFLDAAGPQLRIVANYAVGLDNVDLAAARELGVVVTNTPGVPATNATAEHAIGLTLRPPAKGLPRATADYTAARSVGVWGPDFMVGEGLRGERAPRRRAGRIRSRVGELATAHEALDSRFAGRGGVPGRRRWSTGRSRRRPALIADRGEARHLIGEDALASMKPTAVLVNTARGPVVDERALVAALVSRLDRWRSASTSSRTSLR